MLMVFGGILNYGNSLPLPEIGKVQSIAVPSPEIVNFFYTQLLRSGITITHRNYSAETYKSFADTRLLFLKYRFFRNT